MREWKGLKVPVEPKKEWKEDQKNTCCVAPLGTLCVGIDCEECIYSFLNSTELEQFYKESFPEKPKKLPKRDSNGRFCKKAATLPKLTVEVFNRPDCPEWACFAAVDKNGEAHFYSRKPLSDSVYSCWYIAWCTDRDNLLRIESARRAVQFDASDWQHSLIQRPVKELPKLTQTAFHSPDCPKEATTLKVFPANHVVALDKDNKVLQVMELQCEEGEVRKPVSDWYYSPAADDLYRADESDRRIPEDAYPVEVYHHSPGYLVGLAVTHRLTERIYLISDVRGNLVTLKGIDRDDVLSMVSLILNYRFTGTKEFCCEFERL